MPTVEHPDWCDLTQCTVSGDADLSRSWHRSAEIKARGRLRATGRISKIDRSYPTLAFIAVSVDSSLHGVSEIEVSAQEARDLGKFLLALSYRALGDPEPTP
jgi:hypothetical protein